MRLLQILLCTSHYWICNNNVCKLRQADIKTFNNDIRACVDTSKKAIQCKSIVRKSLIPGWNDMIKNLHHKAVFWHNI